MKNNQSKIAIQHFVFWLLLSVVYFFSVEPLLHALLPGFHTIEIWVTAEIAGLVFILAVILISWLVRRRRGPA